MAEEAPTPDIHSTENFINPPIDEANGIFHGLKLEAARADRDWVDAQRRDVAIGMLERQVLLYWTDRDKAYNTRLLKAITSILPFFYRFASLGERADEAGVKGLKNLVDGIKWAVGGVNGLLLKLPLLSIRVLEPLGDYAIHKELKKEIFAALDKRISQRSFSKRIWVGLTRHIWDGFDSEGRMKKKLEEEFTRLSSGLNSYKDLNRRLIRILGDKYDIDVVKIVNKLENKKVYSGDVDPSLLGYGVMSVGTLATIGILTPIGLIPGAVAAGGKFSGAVSRAWLKSDSFLRYVAETSTSATLSRIEGKLPPLGSPWVETRYRAWKEIGDEFYPLLRGNEGLLAVLEGFRIGFFLRGKGLDYRHFADSDLELNTASILAFHLGMLTAVRFRRGMTINAPFDPINSFRETVHYLLGVGSSIDITKLQNQIVDCQLAEGQVRYYNIPRASVGDSVFRDIERIVEMEIQRAGYRK